MRVRARGEDIRKYIVDNIEKYPDTIAKSVADKFGITRQAVSKHLKRLTDEKVLTESGQTRARSYRLSPLVEWRREYRLVGSPTVPAEDVVWTNDIRSALENLPDNVLEIWHYGFTEMFNNAVDHSGGNDIIVRVRKTAADTEMVLLDDGVGIFKKIQAAMNLLDERHAVLELAKGKFTTDPARHTGEGIFFTSRMFDSFDILSGGVYFTHEFGKSEDWILERDKLETGTGVWMRLNNHTARTTKKVFDQFSSEDDYSFNKTVVPVKLAKYGDDNLISRSQAKRLLARIELFKIVILDFKEVPTIGQAFADEVFRVFPNEHPNTQLLPINTNSEVKRMIERVTSAASTPENKSTS